MKKILSAILILLVTVAAVRAQVIADTIITVSGRSVILELPDGTTVVEVTDTGGETVRYPVQSPDSAAVRIERRVDLGSNINIKLGHDSRWNAHCGGFNVGWTSAPGHPGNMPVEMGKSWEIGWAEIMGVGYKATKTTEIRLGFGIDWRSYRITTPDSRFAFGVAGNIVAAPYPDAAVSPISSRLKVFNLQLPLSVKQKMPFHLFGQEQWIAAGITFNCSPHASMLTRYATADGAKVKLSSDRIGQRRWSYELSAIIGLSEIVGVYLRYQPVSVLSGIGQPDFRSFSTGLIFFY